MPLSFETQMIRIGELFSDAAAFEMPAFQRPYRWDEDTAAQLHDDISAAMIRGRPEKSGRKNRQDCFLGPVIVTRDRTSGVFEVIDGQRVDWQPYATMVTPATAAHSHHNGGGGLATFLIVQDGGLFYHCRTIGFSFA